MKTHIKSKIVMMLFLASILLTWQGCTKDGSESVEGRVLEYGTNKPVPNATVYLMEVKGTILGPSGSKVIDSTLSNHEGKYKFTYMDNPYVSEIRGKANLYYDNHAYIMGTGRKLKTDLILDPHAWLRIHVKSNNPNNTTNAIHLDNHSFECKTGGFWGPLLDTTAVCQFKGGRIIDFRYRIATSENGNENFVINQYLSPQDTTTNLIEF